MDYVELYNSIYLFGNGTFVEEYLSLLSNSLYLLPSKLSTSLLPSILDQSIQNSSLHTTKRDLLKRVQLKMKNDPSLLYVYQSLYIDIEIPTPLYIFFTSSIQYKYQMVFSQLIHYHICSYSLKKCYELQQFFRRQEEQIEESQLFFNIIYQLQIQLSLFFENLENYFFYDILYVEYNQLLQKLTRCKSIDELSDLHHQFINTIIHHLFIEEEENPIKKLVNEICKICYQYCTACVCLLWGVFEECRNNCINSY